MSEQLRVGGHRFDRQHVECQPRQRAAVERSQRGVDVDDRAARRVDEERSGRHRGEHRRADHSARLLVERHVQRHDVALREDLRQVSPLDVGGEVAVDDVGVAGDDALEHVAADVRHPLADPPQPDDAERHVGRAAQLARRLVVPPAGADVAVVGDDVAHHRQRQRQRVRRDLADAVVGRIGDPDAVLRAGVGVDVVEPGADPADDAQRGQCGDRAFGDRRVLRQDGGTALRRGDQLGVVPALRGGELDAGGGEQAALDVDVGKIEIGEQDFGHGWEEGRDGEGG